MEKRQTILLNGIEIEINPEKHYTFVTSDQNNVTQEVYVYEFDTLEDLHDEDSCPNRAWTVKR